MDAGAKQLAAFMTRDVEVQLVALHFAEAAGDDDGPSWRGRREVPHMHLIADRCVAFRQQAFYGTMAGDLHEPDHRWGGKRAIAADMVGEELSLDDSLESHLERLL